MTEREIFTAALKQASADRATFLDRCCGEDRCLRERVESLLQEHEALGSFLERPAEGLAAGLTADETPGEILMGEDLGFLAPADKPGVLGRLGHYDILEVIGRGGMGIVLRAFDEKLHRVVAIKVMLPELATTSPPRKRFLREARSAAAVRHEHVVDIHAVEEQPIPYLVMEYVCGETLQQKHERVGPFEVREVLRLGQQIARGLAAAHEHGLIHRDIKPSNIVLEKKAEERVKITDFGLARAISDSSLTQSGVIAGTPMYMAPEQTVGDSIDHRADLFSLGSVLYTMCSGRPPFRATSTMATLKRVAEDTPRPIREIIPEVPEWLCNIIAKLQAKKPEDRFQSALEVADLLGRCLTSLEQGEPVVLEPSARLAERPAAVKSRGRRGWAFPAAVLLVLVGAITLTEATGVTNVRATVIRFFTGDGTRAGDGNDPGDGKLVVDVNAPGAKVVETKRSAEPSRSTLMAPWSNSTAWVIEGEELVQPDDSPGLHMLLFGDKSWTDYDFEAEVKITAGWQIAFDFRTTWQGQGMSAVIGRAGNTRHSIMETSGAHYREVCEVPGKTTIGRWYRVRVEARGNSFKMFLDGELLTSGYQEGFSRGRVGLSMNRVSARFRNLKVTAPDGKVLLEGVHNVLPRAKDARVSTGKDRPTFVTPWLDSDDWVIEGRDLVVTDGGRWHMLLLGDPSWADYNLEAEVKIVAGGSEVGLVFRARNPHHRLSAMLGGWGNTSHGLMTLSKAVAGGLRLVPGRTEKDRWYRVRVEARGNSFKMFLDGKLLTVGYHEDYPRGCVGLFAAPSSARFRNLKVTDPSGKVLLEGVPAVLPKAKDVAYREVGAALQDAVRLKSDNSEAHFALGSFHAQWGDWKKAAAEYDRGLELDPTSDFRLRQAAVVHAAYGDLEGYRRTCQKMFNRFRDTDDPLIAEGTARTCLLLPDAVSAADFDRVRKLAERGVTGTEKHGWYHYLARTKALADYRTEQYAEALKWLDRSAPKANGNHEDASMFAILSIVLHRLGRTKEAEVALAKAKAIIAKLPDTAPGRPFGNEWLAPVMAWLDCRQAESLLKKK